MYLKGYIIVKWNKPNAKPILVHQNLISDLKYVLWLILEVESSGLFSQSASDIPAFQKWPHPTHKLAVTPLLLLLCL